MKRLTQTFLLLAMSVAYSDTIYNVYPQQPQQQAISHNPLAYRGPECRYVKFIGSSGTSITLDDESTWIIEHSRYGKEQLQIFDVVTLVRGTNVPGNFILRCTENGKNVHIRIQEDVPPSRKTTGNYNLSYLCQRKAALTTTDGRQYNFELATHPYGWQLNDSIIVSLQPEDPCCGNSYWNYYIYSYAASKGVKARLVN